MTKLHGSQLSLIAEIEVAESNVGDWHYDELGTNQILVPNFSPLKLGTKEIPVPNFSDSELGTEQILVPNFSPLKLGTKEILVPNFSDSELGTEEWTPPNYDDWKPPIGGFEQKWIKDHQYWYWRYYNVKGKKASLYLAKDYNKAVRKAIKIGVPTDAKLPNLSASHPQGEAPSPTTDNLIDLSPTANSASRNRRAA